MNYITKLQANAKVAEQFETRVGLEVTALRSYLLSEKFRCGNELDGYVSIQDVLRKLDGFAEAAMDYCDALVD